MPFSIHKNLGRDYYPYEEILGTDAEAYTRGQIAKLTSGRLTQADGTSAGSQTFLVDNAQAAQTTASTPIRVLRIFDDVEYVVENPGGLAAANIGTKYTLNSDADGITTTSTDGVFELVSVFTLNNTNFVSGMFVKK